jgi:hypothetical protein
MELCCLCSFSLRLSSRRWARRKSDASMLISRKVDKEIGTHLCFAGFLRISTESSSFFSWPINIDYLVLLFFRYDLFDVVSIVGKCGIMT